MLLADIREIVKARWKFDAETYPDLRILDGGKPVLRFVRGHILKHAMKAIGGIAEVTETADHGRAFLDEKDRMIAFISKMLVNVMQFAESYDISDKEIEDYIARNGIKPD